jgi:hypothetical protein
MVEVECNTNVWIKKVSLAMALATARGTGMDNTTLPGIIHFELIK